MESSDDKPVETCTSSSPQSSTSHENPPPAKDEPTSEDSRLEALDKMLKDAQVLFEQLPKIPSETEISEFTTLEELQQCKKKLGDKLKNMLKPNSAINEITQFSKDLNLNPERVDLIKGLKQRLAGENAEYKAKDRALMELFRKLKPTLGVKPSEVVFHVKKDP